jgi:hypothetical protein
MVRIFSKKTNPKKILKRFYNFLFCKLLLYIKKILNIMVYTMSFVDGLGRIDIPPCPSGSNQGSKPTADQARGQEAINERSSQSSDVSLAHALESVSNSNAVDKVCDGITKIFDGLGHILGALFKGIGKMGAAILEGILDLIKNLTEKLREIVNYCRSDVVPLARNAADGTQEGAEAFGNLMGAVNGAPATAAIGAVKNIVGNIEKTLETS